VLPSKNNNNREVGEERGKLTGGGILAGMARKWSRYPRWASKPKEYGGAKYDGSSITGNGIRVVTLEICDLKYGG